MRDNAAPVLGKDARVYAGQVDLLYSNQTIGMLATILNGIVMMTALWHLIPHALLVPWGFALLTVTIIRTLVLIRYRGADSKTVQARKWGKAFIIGMAFSGLVWGSSVLWIFYSGTVEFHLLIAFVIGGMIAGASAVLSSLRSAYYAFSVPAFLPLNVVFFSFADMIHISLGIMMLLFLLFLSINAHTMYQVIRRSFQLRYDKDDLIARLEISRAETQSALDTLRSEGRKREAVEKELRTLSGDLERKVRIRTRELENANRELHAFAYSVSHDLRAPVRAIDGFSGALQKEFGELLGERGGRYLKTVRQSAERMNELIEDILSLSRVSQEHMKLETCDLTGTVRDIAESLRKNEPDRQVEISIQEALTGWGDCGLIRILLENLIGNAWKFTRHAQPARIEFGSFDQEGRRVFYVSDNGVGFDMAYADKLFTPFQRLHSDKEFEGTGIGLATVQRIIYRHEGAIWVESEIGKGARFFFTIKEGTDHTDRNISGVGDEPER